MKMKRLWALGASLLLLLPLSALAQSFPNITEENGCITGFVEGKMLAAGSTVFEEGMLHFDCAAPGAFSQEQWQVISYEPMNITQKALSEALEAVGTKPKENAFRGTSKDPLHRWILYQTKNEMFPHTSVHEKGEATTPALVEAQSIALSLMEALGVQPHMPSVYTLPYDSRAYLGATSDEGEIQEAVLAKFTKAEKANKRDPSRYISVTAQPEVYGMPVRQHLSYPDGDAREPSARTGISCYASFNVQDDGIIVTAGFSNIPVVTAASPISAPQSTWRQALDALLQWEFAPMLFESKTPADRPAYPDDPEMGDITAYACENRVSEIRRCWMGVSKYQLRPAWGFVVDTNRLKDGATIRQMDYYVDAETLEVIEF